MTIIIESLVLLLLGTAAAVAIGAAVAVALVALTEAYYAIKRRIQHSHVYKVARILIKRLNNTVEQVVVVVGPDNSVMEQSMVETFSADQMRGTPIEEAFKEAERKKDSTVGGRPAIKWEPSRSEENQVRRTAGL